VVGSIVITADEDEPAFARVHAIMSHGGGPEVTHLELLSRDPLAYVDAVRRSPVISA